MDIRKTNHLPISNKYTARNSIFKDIIVITSILLVMDFWSYLPFLDGEYGNLEFLLYSSLTIIYFIVILLDYKTLRKDKNGIDKIVLWTIITIFIGIIPSYIDYNQQVFSSFRGCLRLSQGLILYFVLRSWRYDVNRLMLIITFISLVWVLLEIGQQFTYPDFWFSGRFLNHNNVEMRMGLYRFYIWGVDFVMLSLSFWLYKFVSGSKKNKIIVTIVAISLVIGILCYCSRKHIYVVFALWFFYVFKSRGGKKFWISVFVLFLSLLILYILFFNDFNEMNQEASALQGEGEDFIRVIEAYFFLFEFSSSPLYPLWGVGLEIPDSPLGVHMEQLLELDMCQADVGIIGYYSKFGLLGVSAIILYIIKFMRNWKIIGGWLQGFFIMKILLIVFDFWAIWDVGMCAYGVFLYFLYNNLHISTVINENRNINILQSH